MKIGIVADGPKISGSMKYILNLYSRLKKKEDASLFHLAYEGELGMKSLGVNELRPTKMPFWDYIFNFGLHYPIKTCIYSARNSLDIVHFSRHHPFFVLWHKILTKNKIVVTSHDLYNLSHKYLFVLKTILNKADKIIAISNATKEALIKIGASREKIEVVYHGVNRKIYRLIGKKMALKALSKTSLRNKLDIFKKADNILLSISNDTERKNTARVYEAFSRVLKKYPNALLIRVVSIPNEETIAAQTKKFKDNIVFLYGLPDEKVTLLYNISDLLIFPSICEGFGLPLLESISCGTPCVTSNFEPMTEVVGDAGVLVDPYSVDSIYEGIVKCLANRNKLSKKSLERAKLFSLEKNFRETHDIYKKLIVDGKK